MVKHSQHRIELLKLTGVHWKWRMEGSAIFFAEEILNCKVIPDLILVTDMLNVALFKSLLPEKFRKIPICLYFHENQLTYPYQVSAELGEYKERDYHYGFINYTSALVSDYVCFNSNWNKSSFFKNLRLLLSRMPDKRLLRNVERINAKTSILSVGISDDVFNVSIDVNKKNSFPTILWNHRWEYDKNPIVFFEILQNLKSAGEEFKLIVCGEHNKHFPPIFERAKDLFEEEIIHFGFVNSRMEYIELLNQSNIILVTSIQEFFGISVLEACVAGALPILPNRLSYPEIFNHEDFYPYFYEEDEQIMERLKNAMNVVGKNDIQNDKYFTRFKMSNMIKEYDQYFKNIVNA